MYMVTNAAEDKLAMEEAQKYKNVALSTKTKAKEAFDKMVKTWKRKKGSAYS